MEMIGISLGYGGLQPCPVKTLDACAISIWCNQPSNL